ncbi:MAG: APC family permease [Microbacterium gubbeenense]
MTGFARRLGLSDAVAIGLGSMIGAGAFAVWQPAVQAAGSGVLIGLALAAVVAFCNATSSAQLAAVHPVAGGAYAYGNAELGAWWGYLAGWSFVVGKIASCAAMALTFATYAAPGFERPVAILAVIALTVVNLLGVTRTALATKIIVVIVLTALVFVVMTGLVGASSASPIGEGLFDHGAYGVLQSAGLLFFAFAGYARIATMGEEVRDPATTIPRAIVIAFAGAVVVYAVLALTVLRVLGPDGNLSAAPLADVVAASGLDWGALVVRIGAACAALGALLALVAGIGRTSLAMARGGDLPGVFGWIHPRTHVPHRAEIAVAVVVIAILLVADLRGAIGFSSFGVLLYYFVANLAALRQRRSVRRYPTWVQVLGATGCLALAATLPWQSVASGAAVIAIGALIRGIRLLVERRSV